MTDNRILDLADVTEMYAICSNSEDLHDIGLQMYSFSFEDKDVHCKFIINYILAISCQTFVKQYLHRFANNKKNIFVFQSLA